MDRPFPVYSKNGMVILLAVFAVNASGGMGQLINQLHAIDKSRSSSSSILAMVPDLNSAWMPMITFFVFIAVNWWASWYPGAEPGGGGYVAQRIFSAKMRSILFLLPCGSISLTMQFALALDSCCSCRRCPLSARS